MKCSCLIVEDKRNGKRLPGAGTSVDPYIVERQGFDKIQQGTESAQQIGEDSLKLKKSISSIAFPNYEVEGDDGTIIWESPLSKLTIKGARHRVYNPVINLTQYTDNEIEFSGQSYAGGGFYDANINAQPYGVRPQTFENPTTSITCASLDPYFFSGGLGSITANDGVGAYNTISFSNEPSKHTQTVLFLITFQIDDLATAGFPGSVGLGDNAGFKVYLGTDAPTLGMRDRRIPLNQNGGGPFWAPRALRGTSTSYSFLASKQVQKDEQTYTYLWFDFYTYPPGRLLTVRNINIQTIGIR